METTAVQQVRSDVDPVQELVKQYQQMLSAEQIKSLKYNLKINSKKKNTLLFYISITFFQN